MCFGSLRIILLPTLHRFFRSQAVPDKVFRYYNIPTVNINRSVNPSGNQITANVDGPHGFETYSFPIRKFNVVVYLAANWCPTTAASWANFNPTRTNMPVFYRCDWSWLSDEKNPVGIELQYSSPFNFNFFTGQGMQRGSVNAPIIKISALTF